MDFAFTEPQQHWHDAAVQFAREELVEPEAERGTVRPSSGARDMPAVCGLASRACQSRPNMAAEARICPRPSPPWRAWAMAVRTRA